MATLMKGTVVLADGVEHSFTAGPRERIKAERYLKISAADLQAGNIGEEYIAFLVFESLKREGTIDAGVSFDDFINLHLADYEVDVQGESEAQPAN
jgi:hypothetical protein